MRLSGFQTGLYTSYGKLRRLMLEQACQGCNMYCRLGTMKWQKTSNPHTFTFTISDIGLSRNKYTYGCSLLGYKKRNFYCFIIISASKTAVEMMIPTARTNTAPKVSLSVELLTLAELLLHLPSDFRYFLVHLSSKPDSTICKILEKKRKIKSREKLVKCRGRLNRWLQSKLLKIDKVWYILC